MVQYRKQYLIIHWIANWNHIKKYHRHFSYKFHYISISFIHKRTSWIFRPSDWTNFILLSFEVGKVCRILLVKKKHFKMLNSHLFKAFFDLVIEWRWKKSITKISDFRVWPRVVKNVRNVCFWEGTKKQLASLDIFWCQEREFVQLLKYCLIG